jgi:uncharacterized protein YecE (DUF72 family)
VIHVGTSGYDYDAWVGRFYPDALPASQRLAFYASRLSTVESVYTFRRRVTPSLTAKWAAQVPDHFRFALKAFRGITHFRRLANVESELRAFFAATVPLGARRGPILFDLPPEMQRDLPRLESFLQLVPSEARVAFEFRHPSWLDDSIYAALQKAGAALCIVDADDGDDGELPTPIVRTAAHAYVRLRRARYDAEAIARWSKELRVWKEAFVYFKHEDTARGPRYARALVDALTA